VELEKEKIVVLGQVVPGVSVDDLRVGMEVELVIDTLFTGTDDEGNPVDEVIWKWRPLTVGAVDSTVEPDDSEVAA
jgi:hypothetical protein